MQQSEPTRAPLCIVKRRVFALSRPQAPGMGLARGLKQLIQPKEKSRAVKIAIEGMTDEVARWLTRAGVELQPASGAAPQPGRAGRLAAVLVPSWQSAIPGEVLRVRAARGPARDAQAYDFVCDSPLTAASFIISRIAELPAPLLTADEPMFAVIGLAMRRAPEPTAVLLVGETGTGKELLARLIHRASGRGGAMVALNCPTLEGSDIERQLLGEGPQPGAAPDPQRRRNPGFLDLAQDGTLFLDHVDGIPGPSRRALKDAIHARAAAGLSDSAPCPVRYIGAAANPLDKQRSLFAPDSSPPSADIAVPPLRSRRADIRLLAGLFLRGLNPALEISDDALFALESYSFPGNVRELSNLITQLAIDPLIADRRLVTAGDVKGALHHTALAPAAPAAPAKVSRWQQRVARIFESCAGAYPREIGSSRRGA